MGNFHDPKRVEGLDQLLPQGPDMLRALSLAILTASFAIAEEPADWSKYTSHSKITGTIVNGELDKITLEIPKLEARNGGNANGGGNGKKRSGVKLGHEDIVIPYAPAGIVRWEKLPPGSDGKLPTGKALETLKLPVGAPGYAAGKTDLHAGMVVEVQLVRPREVTAAKATQKDLSIKYVMIQSDGKAKDEPKKKN